MPRSGREIEGRGATPQELGRAPVLRNAAQAAKEAGGCAVLVVPPRLHPTGPALRGWPERQRFSPDW
jgi:hypothetical protein